MAKKPEQIVEEQVRAWSLQQSSTDRKEEAVDPWPIITISREPATPGSSLAEAIGSQTGFTVWDRELLQAVARECERDEKLLATLDEHRRNVIESAVRHMLLGAEPSNRLYLRALMRVVRTIAAYGRSLIVGRGAQYICEPQTTLRVRVVAPLASRVRQRISETGQDEQRARRDVVMLDAEQADFVRFHYRRDVDSPGDYDLVLNADAFSVDEMRRQVILAYECKFGRKPAIVNNAADAPLVEA